MNTRRSWMLAALALAAPLLHSGCNPLGLGCLTPIPIQPWVTERLEDKYLHQSDHRTPVLPPIPAGHRPLCEDPPDKAAVLRAMPRVARGVPFIYEEFRDDIEVVVKKIADIVDPPRFFPLVGPAQLHHCHWECTVYYTETVESCYPFPVQLKRRRVEVVYIDRDHLHVVAPTPETQMLFTKDMAGL